MTRKMADAEIREAILKVNPGTSLTFNVELNEWVMLITNSSLDRFNLVEELGTYTVTPDGKLPETEGIPEFKQIVINGRRICFLYRIKE